MRRTGRLSLALVAALLEIVAPSQVRGQGAASAITLAVDESQAARRIAFVHEDMPVVAGPLALAYPKWIPGEHGPTGPIQNVADVRIRAGERMLPWTRDADDIYTLRVDVPAGVNRITVDFAVLLRNTISDHQLLLEWHTVVLYPLGVDKRDLVIASSLQLPPGWKHASSLRVTNEAGARVTFAPTSLERLVDSPVLAGRFLRSVRLASQWPAMLHITGDSAAAVDNADAAQAFSKFAKLLDEDRAMFGFRHFETMHVLVSQSDADPYDGLEHGDAPYNGIPDAGLSKADQLTRLGAPVLAHEQSHSWVGKYRRPAELYSKRDFQGPEQTSLVWVYEGLNTYVGTVLSTRSGFSDAAYARDQLAIIAADAAHQPARASVALVDTATENWVLRTVPRAWSMLRRGQDFYQQGALVWLEADAIIRAESNGERSLDDFLRGFFGQRDTGPIVVPHTRADVEAGLSDVLRYDWHGFFESRVYQVNAAPPVGGFERAGWRLVYNDIPSLDRFWSGEDPRRRQMYSIGLSVGADGAVTDVLPASPAYAAGLGPQMTIVSVDGQAFTVERLLDAIAHPANGKISLVVKNFSSVTTYVVDYPGGLRYPHLERIPDTPDRLASILAARVQ